MLIEDRHKRILEILSEKGEIRAREISDMFDIGFDSARRDLRILEEKGLLIRTHGGAMSMLKVGFTVPRDYTPRHITEVKANYLAIALKAVSMIQTNDVVYITGASVGYFMVQNLPRDIEFTVVVNSVILADELRAYDKITTFVIGGMQTPKGHLRDHFAVNMIKQLRFDKVFITAGAYSADFGMSIQTSNSVSIYEALMASARQTIGLFPHEKIGRTSMLKACEPGDLDILITDSETCSKEIGQIRKLGVEVIVVEEREK